MVATTSACASPDVVTGPTTGPAVTAEEVTTTATTTTDQQPQADLDRRLRDAAWANDIGAARDLIARGADVNAKDGTQQSAYLVTTSEGHLDLLELTLVNGADVASKDSFNGTGLIRAGVEMNHINRLGWTALHESIVLGKGTPAYDDTVRVLVAGGADVRLPSRSDGVVPVEHARRKGYATQVATLERALRQDATGPVDRTEANRGLLAAATAGDADGVALALRAGADHEATDDRRRSALLLAATNDRIQVARVLVALGANANALDAQHDTPLASHRRDRQFRHARGSPTRTPRPDDPQPVRRGVGDPHQRTGPRRLRATGRPDRNRRQPRQRAGVDRTARGGGPG
jgi:ankyrin repeat protein